MKRWRQRLSPAVCLAALALAGFVGNTGKASQIEVLPVTTTVWNGFGADFQPEWFGETKRIDYQVGGGGGGSSFGIISVSLPQSSLMPTPIGLVSSNRAYKATASATVLGVTAKYDMDDDSSSRGPWRFDLARYAEVVNLQDVLLDRGAAVSEQISSITDNAIRASGRVSAAAYKHAAVGGSGAASATGKSALTARYRVTDPVWFEMSGSLVGVGSMDLAVSLTHVETGAALYSLTPAADARRWGFGLQGQLTPGDYIVEVRAQAEAAIDHYQGIPGGMGEFDLSFTASPNRLGDLNGDQFVDGADLDAWKGSFGYLREADLNADDSVDGHDLLHWQRYGAFFGMYSYDPQAVIAAKLASWRKNFGHSAGGDADGNGQVDGADFLMWQRKLGQGSVGQTTAVPEPTAGMALLLAVLSLAIKPRHARSRRLAESRRPAAI